MFQKNTASSSLAGRLHAQKTRISNLSRLQSICGLPLAREHPGATRDSGTLVLGLRLAGIRITRYTSGGVSVEMLDDGKRS